jgi:ATP-dependent Lon protease
VLETLIREYTHEAGVRNFDREIANICRKVARRVAESKPAPKQVSKQSLLKYLGPPRYTFGEAEANDQVGVATGLAWTGMAAIHCPSRSLSCPAKAH